MQVLFVITLLAAFSNAAFLPQDNPNSNPQLPTFYYGHDLSSVLMLESQGKTWKGTDGKTAKLETVVSAGGANFVRSRIWVNPSNGIYNLDYNLRLAKRVKDAGLAFYLDFHYSDTWADPSHQYTPAGWPSELEALCNQVYTYTKSVIQAFINQGIHVDMASIGNEITSGLLWPTGKTPSYYNISRLLHSAAWGVKDSSSDTKIMIHIDNGWEVSRQTYFYDNVLAQQGALTSSDFDIQGVSFYPFYGTSATLANLKSSLNSMVSKYGKDIVVAETNWPVSCPGVALSEKIPVSIAGQLTWMSDIISILKGLPNGHGKGVFYWEPGWLGFGSLGSQCSNNLLFDSSGTPYSSVNMYK